MEGRREEGMSERGSEQEEERAGTNLSRDEVEVRNCTIQSTLAWPQLGTPGKEPCAT
jgi:hypothetical protein